MRARWTAPDACLVECCKRDHCLVLPSTLLLLIGTKALQGIQQIAQQGQHGLALATHLVFHLRKTIHEKGGLADTPTTHPPPNNPPQLRATCEQIAGAVVASETILHHNIKFQPMPEPGCTPFIQTALAKLAPDGPLHVIIQGDILPLIQYLNYNARLRYAGIQQPHRHQANCPLRTPQSHLRVPFP